MSQFFQIHPDNPQSRLIKQAVEIINKGGVVIYPTDSAYAIGCHLGDKAALDRIRDILKELNVLQLIIVSHEQKIESFVDKIIRIKKESGHSVKA